MDGELEYEVEVVLHHRGKGAQHRYLILWKGYPLSEATWEPEPHLLNAPAILADYLRCVEPGHSAQWTQITTHIEGAGKD